MKQQLVFLAFEAELSKKNVAALGGRPLNGR